MGRASVNVSTPGKNVAALAVIRDHWDQRDAETRIHGGRGLHIEKRRRRQQREREKMRRRGDSSGFSVGLIDENVTLGHLMR